MIVFLGDSITQWWDKELYDTYFKKYETINLGMSGYTSRDTLYSIKISNLNGIKANIVVLQIGTNDGDRNISTGETVEYIEQICSFILKYNPNCTILLIGPLPRGESETDKHRVYNKEVNKALSKKMFNNKIYYVDIGYLFIQDGKISKDIMYDFLHLTNAGYQILSEVISEFITTLICNSLPFQRSS